MSDCLFCKIANKEIPSTSVYEDDRIYAFLDIHPVNPGHVLVIPKKHCNGFLDCDSETVSAWILATQKIAKAMKVALDVPGINLEQNEGAAAGQVIMHLHIHIVPRLSDDGLKHWPGKSYATQVEADAVAEKIRERI